MLGGWRSLRYSCFAHPYGCDDRLTFAPTQYPASHTPSRRDLHLQPQHFSSPSCICSLEPACFAQLPDWARTEDREHMSNRRNLPACAVAAGADAVCHHGRGWLCRRVRPAVQDGVSLFPPAQAPHRAALWGALHRSALLHSVQMLGSKACVPIETSHEYQCTATAVNLSPQLIDVTPGVAAAQTQRWAFYPCILGLLLSTQLYCLLLTGG